MGMSRSVIQGWGSANTAERKDLNNRLFEVTQPKDWNSQSQPLGESTPEVQSELALIISRQDAAAQPYLPPTHRTDNIAVITQQ